MKKIQREGTDPEVRITPITDQFYAHPKDFLQAKLSPEEWREFCEAFSGRQWRVPKVPFMSERNGQIRDEWSRLMGQGVRYTDAVAVIARKFNLSAPRVEQLVVRCGSGAIP